MIVELCKAYSAIYILFACKIKIKIEMYIVNILFDNVIIQLFVLQYGKEEVKQ